MKKIKVEQLTKEAFAEFGEVLSYEGREDCGAKGSHTWYPQVVVRDTPTSIHLMEVFRKPFTVKKFEAHDHTEENLFAMTGGIIVPFAPAGKPDPDKVRAFYIPKGMGISCKPGVWHWAPNTLDDSVHCLVIFKNNTSHEDIYFDELPEEIGLEL